MSEHTTILALGVALGFLTLVVGMAADDLPGVAGNISTGAEFEQYEFSEPVNLSNYENQSEMTVITDGSAATDTGNAVRWNGNTNDRGGDYGYIRYNVSGLSTIFVRAEFIGTFQQELFGSPVVAYTGTGSKIKELQGAPGSDEINVSGTDILELRDKDFSSGTITKLSLPGEQDNSGRSIIEALQISSSNQWIQLLVGIPIGLMLAYLAIKTLPFFG